MAVLISVSISSPFKLPSLTNSKTSSSATTNMPDVTHMTRKVKEVIRAAGLRDELSFTSFRHGGLTETGDAELTDREILVQSRHTTPKVLP